MPHLRAGRDQEARRRQICGVRAIVQILPAAIPALLVQEAECGCQGVGLLCEVSGSVGGRGGRGTNAVLVRDEFDRPGAGEVGGDEGGVVAGGRILEGSEGGERGVVVLVWRLA